MSNFFTRTMERAMAVRAVEMPRENEDILTRYKKDKIYVDLKLSSGDYGWTEPDRSVKVFLVNPATCAENPFFSTWNLMSLLYGTGHTEWEALMADVLMQTICKWYKKGANAGEPVDISMLFNRDYLASGYRRFTMEQVSNHLNRVFNIEKVDDDGTRYVSFKIA